MGHSPLITVTRENVDKRVGFDKDFKIFAILKFQKARAPRADRYRLSRTVYLSRTALSFKEVFTTDLAS
jgi:hypothetical protein